MWRNTWLGLEKRLNKVERATIPQWLETLTTEQLYELAGFPRRDDMLLQERSGVPREKQRPFATLTTDQLLRIAHGEDLVTVFDEDITYSEIVGGGG